eukprot:12899708-Prorocentrum_lima.AAC.1
MACRSGSKTGAAESKPGTGGALGEGVGWAPTSMAPLISICLRNEPLLVRSFPNHRLHPNFRAGADPLGCPPP